MLAYETRRRLLLLETKRAAKGELTLEELEFWAQHAYIEAISRRYEGDKEVEKDTQNSEPSRNTLI